MAFLWPSGMQHLPSTKFFVGDRVAGLGMASLAVSGAYFPVRGDIWTLEDFRTVAREVNITLSLLRSSHTSINNVVFARDINAHLPYIPEFCELEHWRGAGKTGDHSGADASPP